MLVLPAELTHDQASACSRMLAQAVRSEAGDAAVADASALTRFDLSLIHI